MNTIALYVILYGGGIVFLAGCVARAVRYAAGPVHLRWEIYPVPHGKPAELRYMIPEIAFLKNLWEFNRPMWNVSYPFHLGLYFTAAGLVTTAASGLGPAGTYRLLHPLAVACGTLGALLGLAGALGLLARRLANHELRVYSAKADFFNLIWFAATFLLLIAGYWLRPAGSPGPFAILRGALRFDAALDPPPLLAAGLISGAVLLAYIPMTHMSHFIAKYFTWHTVRWDERPTAQGSALEKQMAGYLNYHPTWAAPHVGATGTRTWGEIASLNPAEKAK